MQKQEDIKTSSKKNKKQSKKEEVLETKEEQTETKEITISIEEHERLKESTENILYMQAEFDNFKRRSFRDTKQQLELTSERIIRSFLIVLDNINLALEHSATETEDSIKEHRKGLELIKKQFSDVLSSHNVNPIECIGEKFDPNFHEAMDQAEEKDKKAGLILTEYQKGYMIGEKLLRPAKVRVSK